MPLACRLATLFRLWRRARQLKNLASTDLGHMRIGNGLGSAEAERATPGNGNAEQREAEAVECHDGAFQTERQAPQHSELPAKVWNEDGHNGKSLMIEWVGQASLGKRPANRLCPNAAEPKAAKSGLALGLPCQPRSEFKEKQPLTPQSQC